jgi:hypothetical protein
MRFIIFASLFFCCSIAFSQEDPHVAMAPGRTFAAVQQKTYTDSAEFAKLFAEFYPTIKPARTVKEQADQYYEALSKSFAMQGIDSAEAAKAAFKNLDPKAFEKLYFDTYRANLSAKELKKYIEFVKTPEGKHIAEVWSNLQRVSSETNMYVARILNLNLIPIRQAARERMEKEHPPKKMGPGGPGMQPYPGSAGIFDQGNAGSKDSLVRSQRLQKNLPPGIDSVVTPHPKQ